jgi:hypothetical protein
VEKVANGTGHMHKKFGTARSSDPKSANIAALHMKRAMLAKLTSSVLTNARALHAGNQESTMFHANAKSVPPNSPSTDTAKPALARSRVARISAIGKSARVYDLSVDGKPEFFAGGTLVHNCVDAIRYGLWTRIKGGKSFLDY